MVDKFKYLLDKYKAFVRGAVEVESQKRGSQDKDAKEIVLSILSKAKHILDRVQDPMGHPHLDIEGCLCRIAQMEAAYDASIARTTCELMRPFKYMDSVLLEIVKKEAATNPSNAEKLVDEIEDPEEKIIALCHIAKQSPQRRPQLLKAAINLRSQFPDD